MRMSLDAAGEADAVIAAATSAAPSAAWLTLMLSRYPERARVSTRRASAVVRRLAAELAEGMRDALEAGRLPPDVLQRVCAFCEFDLVCRRGPRLDRKEVEWC